jgi:hypothetical protein
MTKMYKSLLRVKMKFFEQPFQTKFVLFDTVLKRNLNYEVAVRRVDLGTVPFGTIAKSPLNTN